MLTHSNSIAAFFGYIHELAIVHNNSVYNQKITFINQFINHINVLMYSEKIDNASRTGAGGGSSAKLTDVDNIVLAIIGHDSPVIKGLGIDDSFGVGGKDLEAASFTSSGSHAVNKNSNEDQGPEKEMELPKKGYFDMMSNLCIKIS